MSDEAFAAPPFKPDAALQDLKRQLRDLRLAERGAGFELRGQVVVEFTLSEASIDARLAKRPARTPEWARHRLASGADVRRFVSAVRQQLARWDEE